MQGTIGGFRAWTLRTRAYSPVGPCPFSARMHLMAEKPVTRLSSETRRWAIPLLRMRSMPSRSDRFLQISPAGQPLADAPPSELCGTGRNHLPPSCLPTGQQRAQRSTRKDARPGLAAQPLVLPALMEVFDCLCARAWASLCVDTTPTDLSSRHCAMPASALVRRTLNYSDSRLAPMSM